MTNSRHPVIVGVDGSPAALGAVRWAADEAARGVALHAVRTWHEPDHRWGRSPDPAGLAADAERGLAADLEPWRTKYPSVAVQARVEHRPSVPALLGAAVDALMIVLGARGRGGFDGVRLGAVAQQVLEHCDAPVLIARRG